MSTIQPNVIDMHMHVGRIGKQQPELGQMSDWYRQQTVFKVFLLYLRLKEDQLNDSMMREITLRTIDASSIGKVVCLALDPVFDESGNERRDRSHVWVGNEYVLDLQKDLPGRILLGASVHPYDPNFKNRVKHYVDHGAALLKWLPSSQQINLADDRVKDAMRFLATVRDGKPLPLLLHCGVEYAIPTSDTKKTSYDFLTWSWKDRVANLFRNWLTPATEKIHRNIADALSEGADIIFAHCGYPYFVSGAIGGWLEHNDSETVRKYLEGSRDRKYKGRCFADVSAFCTPFRQKFFGDLKKLPAEALLFGSDFPTPAFELSAGKKEHMEDLQAVLQGHLDRIVIPEDNLLDVNYHELSHFFPDHPMFTNFHSQLLKPGTP